MSDMRGKYIRTEEHRKKMASVARWGGKKLPEEVKQKIREARARQVITEEHKKNIGLAHKGRMPKNLPSLWGKNHWSWKGGITPINQKIRHSLDYKIWREKVFERDDYRCFDCGQRGGKLHAHHILSFALFPRIRFDINNGITLCVECHKRTDSFLNNQNRDDRTGRYVRMSLQEVGDQNAKIGLTGRR